MTLHDNIGYPLKTGTTFNPRTCSSIDMVCSKEALVYENPVLGIHRGTGIIVAAATLAEAFKNYPINWEA